MEQLVEQLANKAPSASEIADWIRTRIRSNRLVPGQRLVEVDIIRKTGGSRFKVREAFQRLTAEGLVEIEEGRGASVRDVSMDEVRQLYSARAALEGLCARDFTRKASQADKDRLEQLALDMESCVADGAPERFARLNAEWHSLFVSGSSNEVIGGIVKRLNTPVHHLLFETFYSGSRLREAIADHRLILDAVLAGDALEAEQAMRRHVLNGLQFLSGLERHLHDVGELD
ncbi:GntR family transcriptional regulator [Aurantiacibacter flavus]|uniref:GntR family transcriptional regulator n=1 Tax=Aurantiacibacter flavus TaxID=3145232 RepID=A0ABV0CRS5_9SPHN